MFSLMDHRSAGLMKIILLDTQELGAWLPNLVLPSNHFPWEGERAKYKEFIKEGQAVEQLIHMSPSNHNKNC